MISLELDPALQTLARALGLVGPDGHLVGAWLEHPLTYLKDMFADGDQRAALFSLLDTALPPADEEAWVGTTRYHPLLDPGGRGNVYLTTDGQRVGVAARLRTPVGVEPQARASISLPLVDASGPSVRAVAGSPTGPLEVILDAIWGVGADAQRLGVVVRLDLTGRASLRLVLDNVDLGAGVIPHAELDAAHLDAGAVITFTALLRDVLLSLTGAEEDAQRVADYLPELLGLVPGRIPFPFTSLAGGGDAARGWLRALAGDADALRATLNALLGLLGGSPAGTGDTPLRGTVLALGQGATLDLMVAVSSDATGAPVALRLGVELDVAAPSAALQARATVVSIPLVGNASVIVLPEAAVLLRAPGTSGALLPPGPLTVGSLAGGLQWDGIRVVPLLELRGVVIGGQPYARLDLTDANAVGAAVNSAVDAELRKALGGSGAGAHLLPLLGLAPPSGDTSSPHRIAMVDFVTAPTAALATFHRAVLADAAHPWSELLDELAGLLGVAGTSTGQGTPEAPWVLDLAATSPFVLRLVAWQDLPAGALGTPQRLRVGLELGTSLEAGTATWRAALLDFDLAGTSGVSVFTDHRVQVRSSALSTTTPGGLALSLNRVVATAEWRPGAPITAGIQMEGLRVSATGESVGPLDLALPVRVDAAQSDLGLGIAPAEVVSLARLVVAEVLRGTGGEGAAALGALAGLHRRLPGLPADWPLLTPPDPADLRSLLADPVALLTAQLRSVLTGVSADGTQFLAAALPSLAGVVGHALPVAELGSSPLIAGAGTPENPWALPMVADGPELLLWLDPAGPPGSVSGANTALDGAGLVARLSGLPGDAAEVAAGRSPATIGPAVDALGAWLTSGDGFVPLASQLDVPAAWTVGAPVAAPHLAQPGHPEVIAQVAAALNGWAAGPRAVLLLGPAFADASVWSSLLDVVEPGHPPQAAFHLRTPGGDPAGVTAVARHYPVELADRNATTAELVTRLGVVVERVRALTGQAKVYLVAHSTAGVTARTYAEGAPDRVAGLVTVGAPFAGSPLTPLTDPAFADAVRLTARLAVSAAPNPLLSATRELVQALDGWTDSGGGAVQVPFPTAPLPGAPSAAGAVPGYVVPCGLSGSIVQILDGGLADARPTTPIPTACGYGVRLPLDVPAGAPGDIVVAARVRVDLGRLALGEPSQAPTDRGVRVEIALDRPGGWLIGSPRATGVRLRRADLGVTVVAAAGGTVVTPLLRLQEAGTDGHARDVTALDDLVGLLGGLPGRVALTSARPAPGTPAVLVVDLLCTLGLLAVDGTGGLALDVEELVAVADRPAERLGPRLPALLNALGAAAGLQGPAGGPWRLAADGLPLEVEISRVPWSVTVRTPVGSSLQCGPVGVTGAVRLTLPAFTMAAEAAVTAGGAGSAQLVWRTPTPLLTLTVAGTTLPLVPLPADDALVAAAGPLLARAVPAAAASAALGAFLGTPIRGIDALVTSPGAWLLRQDVLGTAQGRPDPAKIVAVVRAVAGALGAPTTGNVTLPGDLVLTFPAAALFALGGTLDVAGATAELDLTLGVDAQGGVVPTGAVVLNSPLLGTWRGVSVRFGTGPDGFLLRVTPGTGTPIDMLPHFGGLGQLVGGAGPLLAHLLQEMVKQVAPPPAVATGMLDAALRLAKAFGWYDFDAAGFERADRATELGRALTPGWFEAKSAEAGVIADAVLAVTSHVPLPVGAVVRDGDRVRWSFSPVTGATVSAAVGFTAGSPTVRLAVENLSLGPVMAQDVTLAYDGTLRCTVVVALDTGDELAWLQPALSVGVGAAGLAVELDPLGTGAAADARLVLAPRFAAELSEAGALDIVAAWVIPLTARLLLDTFSARMGQLWTGGPTVRTVLETAQVIVPASDPPVLRAALPPPADLVLRVLAAVMTAVEIDVGGRLSVSVVSESGRHGIRLHGSADLGGDEVTVHARFGSADWLPGATGATLWLLEDGSGTNPLRLTPALELDGVGAGFTRPHGPLVKGALTIDALAALVFARVDLLDGRVFKVSVTELGAAVEVDGARLVVSSDDGDSFLKNILPPSLEAPFDVVVAYQAGPGLALYGGLEGEGLTLSFPLDLDLLLVHLTELFLGVELSGSGGRAQVALSGRADLGVLRASIARVGIQVRFGASGSGLAFRAPDGIGLVLDVGVVSGGGFLYIDEAKGQYAGGLQLQLECLSLTALGLLNTKMPDGSPIPGIAGLPGFSLLIIITAELPPIQLGFGFTLNGIGGLLGLNRTLNLPALRAGVRTRALDSILFPKDPAGNAETLIETLSAVFPVAPNRFVVGPMVRLGWGTPTIVQLDLGVLIELPAPVRVALLGRLRIGLPQPGELAVVSINLDAMGAIDFGTGEISIDAEIYDSQIAGFNLTGGMALRARFREDPAFALAVGGFHPAFTPPPGFPQVDRIALSLSDGENPRLRLETYLAVTSNTVQFGAAVELHAEAGGAAIDGFLAFDALLRLAPFGIDVAIVGSVAVTFQGANICSVSVRVRLTGPGPWHVSGEATVKVLLLSMSVRFDKTIGTGTPPPLPLAVDVAEKVVAAIADSANWSAQPPRGQAVVSLRGAPNSGGPVLAHPLGALSFSQQVVPLGLTIERFGPAPVSGTTYFDVTAVTLGNQDVPVVGLPTVTASYAPAQYLDLPEDQQLTRPSFETHRSGVMLPFDGIDIDELAAGEAARFDYEVIVVDDFSNGQTPARAVVASEIALASILTGAAAVSAADKTGPRRFATSTARVELHERRFTTAHPVEGVRRLTGVATSVAGAVGMTYSQAAEAVAGERAAGREVQVAPVAMAGGDA